MGGISTAFFSLSAVVSFMTVLMFDKSSASHGLKKTFARLRLHLPFEAGPVPTLFLPEVSVSKELAESQTEFMLAVIMLRSNMMRIQQKFDDFPDTIKSEIIQHTFTKDMAACLDTCNRDLEKILSSLDLIPPGNVANN